MNYRINTFLLITLLASALCNAEPVSPPAPRHTVRVLLVDSAKPGESLRGITKSLPMVDRQRIGSAVHWPANVKLDGEALFERYEGNRLTVRLPVRTIELAAGEHVIEPGEHKFFVGEDGKVSSADPEFIIEGRDIRLKCYPVVVQVVDGEEQGAFSARRLAGAFTVSSQVTRLAKNPKPGEPKVESVDAQLVPEGGMFAPLTLFLPSNTKGPGYILRPFGVTFHLTGGRVKLIVPEGSTPMAEAVGLDIGLPTRAVDIVLRTVKDRVIKATMNGLKMSGNLQLPTRSLIKSNKTEKRFSGTISPRAVPVELFAGAGASSLRVPVDCSFTEYAHMTILTENTLTDSEAASMLMVEYNDLSLSPGQRSVMRVSYVDAGPSTGAQPKTAVFVRPVGREDAPWQKVEADSSPEFVLRYESYKKAKTDPKELIKIADVRGAKVSLKLPPLRMGVYDMLVALDYAEPKSDSRLVVIRPVVLIPLDSAGALGFFTQKNRDAFNLGEDIRIGLAAKSGKALPGGAPEVTMTGPNGGKWKLSLTSPGQGKNHATFYIRLPAEVTNYLNPGGYTFTAEWNGLLSAKKSIDLVDPHRPTHFLSVLPTKYSTLGATYHEALLHDFDEPDGAERIVQFAQRMGHNQIDFMHYVTDRTKRWPSLRERIYAKFPDTPPAESFYRPTPRDRLLNEGVRRGVGINDTLITFADSHAPRHIEPLLRCTERWIALEAQSMKHSPATSGITFYDELYAIGLIAPPGQAEAFQKLAKLAYREKYGISPAQLTKDIPRFTERPKKRRDLKVLEDYFSWYRFLEQGWTDMNRRLQIASKRVLPTLRNTTRHRIWGTPGYSMDGEHGYIPAVNSPLDIGGFVTYSDNISGWPLTHAMMADVYGFDPKKPHYLTIPFSQSDDNGEYLQQNFFSGLSQKIHGAAFYQQPGLDPIGPWTRVAEGNRDLFHGIARRYGDLFMALEPGYKKVGLYYSWRAQILSPHKKFATVAHKTEGLWISCIRAGFPADMIFDVDINSGRAAEYSVILIPGIEFEQELSEDILNGLRKLIAAGKTVVVEKGSKLPIDGVVTMENTEWDEFYQPLYQASNWDDELVRTYRLTEDLTVKLRDFLGRYVPPAAGHSMTVGPDWLRYGETWYLVVSNFEDPMFSYLHRQRLVAPAVRTLTVYDKPSVCYDALEMKRVELKPAGDAPGQAPPGHAGVSPALEKQKFDADLRTSNGKIYAFMKRPIGSISLECSSAPSAADDLAVRVQVVDDSGALISGAFPIELKLIDPKGGATERYRAAAPVLNEIFHIPGNAAPGEWKLVVRELVAGHESTHKFQLEARQDSIKLAEDSRDVLVHDPTLVKLMLAEMKEVVVPVEDGMSDSVGTMVEKLRPAFKASGIELRAVRPSEVEIQSEEYRKQGVYNEYSHWGGRMTWDSEVIGPKFHVDHPVILLDLGGKHKWTAHLLRYGLMLDVPSKHNPGAGRAIVVPAPMSFHYSKGTIVITSGDVAGLERGMNALLKLLGHAGVPPAPEAEQARKDGQPGRPTIGTLRSPMPPGRRPDKELLTPPTGKEKAFGNLTKAGDATVRKTSTRRLAHLENIVSAIAVDPVNGRIVVGTRGYGDNLFCFDMQGKKLWSRYLSEYHVRVVEITPDGKHIFATCRFDDRTYMLDAADGNIRWSLVNVPKKRIPHVFEGYASSYSTPTIFPKAQKLVLHYRDSGAAGFAPVAKRPPGSFAAIIGFDGKLEREVKIPKLQNGPVFSPDVEHFATIHVVDHKEKYQPPPINGKKRPPLDIAVAYDHLRIYRSSDGQQASDTSLGKVGLEHYRVAWKTETGPEVVLYGKREQFDFDPGHAGVSPASANEVRTPEPAGRRRTQEIPYTIDENGIVHAADPEGREKWKCSVQDPSPDTGHPGACLIASLGDRGVIAGTSRGRIVHVDGSGKVAWRVWLGDLNQPPGDYPAFVDEGRRNNRDISAAIWPTITDREGDLDAKVKLGINRLENPSFESDTGGWTMESEKKLPLATPAQSGKQALRVGGLMVSQEVKRHVSRMATYVLEFHYQALAPRARLIAGTLIDGGERVASSVPFEGNTGEWKFGRVATKTYDNTDSIAVGFYAEGGEVLIDNVRLRQIRWPSANHMQNLPLHKVKPIWVESFRIPYRGAPERYKDQLTNKVYIPILPGLGGRALFMDSVFLQNGRLNDTKSKWYMNEAVSYVELIWQKPAWVSHLAFYFHQNTPDRVMQNFFVSYIDSETQKWKRIDHVKGLRKLFFVLKFAPIFTGRIRIEEDSVHPRHRTLTEIEAFGPLGGQETAAGFSKEPEAFSMYMGGPDHVDRRPLADLTGEFKYKAEVVNVPPTDELIRASTGTAPAIVDGRYYFGSNHGHVIANDLDKRADKASISRPTRWGFLTPPTIYGGRIVLGGASGTLHGLRADNAELLYESRTNGRIYAAPVPNGDDLYVASMDGTLYKLDIANGSVLWNLELGGELRASPAFANGVVVAVTTAGKVIGADAVRGTIRWQTEIAPESVGSPAIDQARVYLGDSAGVVHCLDLSNGKPIWRRETGTTIETCPTIRNGSLFITNLDGEVLRLTQSNGAINWRVQAGAENNLEPAATATQLLVASPNRIQILRQSDGKPDERFISGKENGHLPVAGGGHTITGFCIYKGGIYLTVYPQKNGPIYLNEYGWNQRNVTIGRAIPIPPKGGKK